jgi:N-methylhydantoinase B/oxoprolinase/acetone carboxylase alpha subunit
VSSPRNSEEKRLAIEIKKEENLLDFEGSSHSNGDPTNTPEPLFSLVNI